MKTEGDFKKEQAVYGQTESVSKEDPLVSRQRKDGPAGRPYERGTVRSDAPDISIPPMKRIARIHTDFPEKFGIPRQAGLVKELRAVVVLEPEYRVPEALRGLEGFSYIWLIWLFSEAVRDNFSPTVRPPKLGGNTRMGVFATRSPFRPNPIGLSSVRLEEIRQDAKLGPVLIVSGADLLDGTPILDIKPYLPYTDSHPDAAAGFANPENWRQLEVIFPGDLLAKVPVSRREALIGVLRQDPRPSYQEDASRVYGLKFGEQNIRFTVEGCILTVREIT